MHIEYQTKPVRNLTKLSERKPSPKKYSLASVTENLPEAKSKNRRSNTKVALNLRRDRPQGPVLYRNSHLLKETMRRAAVCGTRTKESHVEDKIPNLNSLINSRSFNPDEAAMILASILTSVTPGQLRKLITESRPETLNEIYVYLGMPILIVGSFSVNKNLRQYAGSRSTPGTGRLQLQGSNEFVEVFINQIGSLDQQIRHLNGRAIFAIGLLRNLSPKLGIDCATILE